MTAALFDGRALASRIRSEVREQVKRLEPHIGPITLVSVEVGENPESALFARNQERAAREVGIHFRHLKVPQDVEEDALVERLLGLDADASVTGLLLQRPLPPGLNVRRLQAKIHPDKDVEGLNPANMGYIVLGEPRLAPCTAVAALRVLRAMGIDPHGRDAVVIGHSVIVGKPIAFLLLNASATVTICHVATQDLEAHTRKAEIVFVAVGRPGLVTGDMIRPGAAVIDIGINTVEIGGERRVVGDVDFDSVRKVAGHLTPVPGGVGPVTVATLLSNAVRAALLQHPEAADLLGEPLTPRQDSVPEG